MRALPLFRGVPAEEIDRLCALASLRSLQKGDVLWQEGDAPEHLTVILRGRIKVVHHASAGDVLLEIFGSDEAVGAFAVYNRMPYPASAVAIESTTILALPAPECFALLTRHPALARALVRELTRVHTSLLGRMENLAGQRVEARLARMFLTLGERMGRTVDGGTAIPLVLSRQEIAEMIGTTIETAIRIMSRWARIGVLTTEPEGFVIPSPDRLRAIAEGQVDGATVSDPGARA